LILRSIVTFFGGGAKLPDLDLGEMAAGSE